MLKVVGKNKVQDKAAVQGKNKVQDKAAVQAKNKVQDKAAVQGKNKVQDKAAVQVNSSSVPFFPMKPDFPKWAGNIALTGTDFMLLGNAAASVDPFKDPAKPIVFLTPKVLKEVQYIVDRMADKIGECAWMFLGKPLRENGPHVLLYHYFLASQDATRASVDLDMEDVTRYTTYLKEQYPDQWGTNGDVAQCLHHGHSHGNMGVFWSGTDKTQQESPSELGFQSDRRYFLVFNNKKEVHASMVLYRPVFHRFDDIPVGIYTGNEFANPCLDSARKKEIDAQLDALVKKPVLSNFGNFGYDFIAKENKNSQTQYGIGDSFSGDDDITPLEVATARTMCMDTLQEMDGPIGKEDVYAPLRVVCKKLLSNKDMPECLADAITPLREMGFFTGISERKFLTLLTNCLVEFWGDLYSNHNMDFPEDFTHEDLSELVALVLDRITQLIDDLQVLMDTIFWPAFSGEMKDQRDILFAAYGNGMQSYLFDFEDLLPR